MRRGNLLPTSDTGVWIGAALLLLALVVGIVAGVAVMSGIADHGTAKLTAELDAARAERDAAVKESAFWRATLKALVDGDGPKMAVSGRVSAED